MKPLIIQNSYSFVTSVVVSKIKVVNISIMENTEKFLDWLVALDVQHYKTGTATHYYTPRGESHFYLRGSPERFTSMEMIKIFNNQADDDLLGRWNYAIIHKQKK